MPQKQNGIKLLTPLEQKLINSYKDEMVSFLESNPEYFEEAVNLSITDKQPFAWRSAWLLWSCMEENDKRIRKHIKSIIDSIKSKKDGHQRELLKILYKMEIDKVYEGHLFDLSINLWEQIDKDPSVRLTALKIMIKIANKHSEIAKEIAFFIQDQYLETLSPGVKKAIDKMMTEFFELNKAGRLINN